MVFKKRGAGPAKRPANENGTAHPAINILLERLRERLKAKNLTGRAAARLAGVGVTYVNDILDGSSKNPDRFLLAKVGEILDTDIGYFFGEQHVPRQTGVPLFRVGLSDSDGFVPLTTSDGSVSSPFALPEAYVVSVPDDMMSPRYKAGEGVLINPRAPVSSGGYILLKMTDGRAAIRELVSVDTEKINIRSIASATSVEIPRANIAALERIVGSCELN